MNIKTNQLQSDTYIRLLLNKWFIFRMLSVKLKLIYLVHVQYTKTSDSLTHISQSFTNKK